MDDYAGPVDFEEWYLEQHPRVLAALVVIARDVDIASDAADEAFARAYERWPRVSAMESPGGWVQTVALNQVRRRLRLRRVSVRAWMAPAADPPASLTAEVWDAVRALPERQRSAIALRYLLDLSQADVAEAMGIAPGTASATLSAARRSLAQALDTGNDEMKEVTRARTR